MTGVFVNAFTDRSNTGAVLKLTASDGATDDWFGFSVSIDGDTMVIGRMGTTPGGSNSGSACVFTRVTGRRPCLRLDGGVAKLTWMMALGMTTSAGACRSTATRW